VDLALKRTSALLVALVVLCVGVVALTTVAAVRSDDVVLPPLAETAPAAGAAVFDAFDRENAPSLGAPVQGPAWSAVGVDWGIEDRQARIMARAGDAQAVVLTAAPSGDARVEVVLAVLENEAGLVFRFQDLNNYWKLVAVPHAATFVLSKIVDGQLVVVGNAGVTNVLDGTTIGVELDGPSITILVDGVERGAFEDDDLATATGVGLLATADAELRARFDDFIVIER
jgi:hypothetical protein